MRFIKIKGEEYDMSSPTSEEFKRRTIESFGDEYPNNIPNVTTFWTHIDGFELHLQSDSDEEFTVDVYDKEDNLLYNTSLKNGMFCKLSRKYYNGISYKIFWNQILVKSETISFEGKRVFIVIDSASLGDSLAWIPYCEEFGKTNNCQVIVSSFMNDLYKNSYPSVEFVEPGSVVHNIHGLFRLGWFYNGEKEPEHPVTIPLQQAATNILGLQYREIKTNLDFTPSTRPISEKYITISTHGTSGCKLWNNPNGWQELVDYLNEYGYKVAVIQKESIGNLKNVLDWTGNFPLERRLNEIHHSEFFIGLGSGVSWLSWALGKTVVMISNFSADGHEFTENCIRIKNESLCHGCWNDPNFKFDKSDWNWCPIFKGTERQFECHKLITSNDVIQKIQNLL
jgi:autotransporter strand-loop-strand O-heptosyltransferase